MQLRNQGGSFQLSKKHLDRRTRDDFLFSQMMNGLNKQVSIFEENAKFILARRPRFTTTDVNSGDRRNESIIDSTGTFAAKTLRSGMMAGITSPARPWFMLKPPGTQGAEFGDSKRWMDGTTRTMRDIFSKSNLYNILPIVYGDLGTFGIGAMLVEEDFETDESPVRFESLPVGSFCIANDHKGRVRYFGRKFTMTVAQIIEKFGVIEDGEVKNPDVFSDQVLSLYATDNLLTEIEIIHIIHPNDKYNPRRFGAKFMRYRSAYYESGATNTTGAKNATTFGADNGRYLREAGYEYFPVLVPRWELTGEDAWPSSCPASDAIGDIKALQFGELRSAEAVDKNVRPTMKAPLSMKNAGVSTLPGEVVYSDQPDKFESAYNVNLRIDHLEQKQEQIRGRINRAFYADLFLMLANSNRRQITAREIEERHEEKLLALGPVLEQLNHDLLNPLIDITFSIMVKRRLIEDPPKELEGQNLKVEYVSIMAQAQKLVGIAGIERFLGFVAQIAPTAPQINRKIDWMQVVDEMGDMLTVPASIIRSDEEVAEIEAAEAQAMQAQQKQQMMIQAAGAAKDLSQANLSGDNALSRIVEGAAVNQEV